MSFYCVCLKAEHQVVRIDSFNFQAERHVQTDRPGLHQALPAAGEPLPRPQDHRDVREPDQQGRSRVHEAEPHPVRRDEQEQRQRWREQQRQRWRQRCLQAHVSDKTFSWSRHG